MAFSPARTYAATQLQPFNSNVMRKLMKQILILTILLLPIVSYANDGIVVNIFNKSFTLPSNCVFWARPSILGEEIKFICKYWKPIDTVTVYFYKKQFCEKEINDYKKRKIKLFKDEINTSNNQRYVEWTTIQTSKSPSINTRLIIDKEVCVYSLGVYKTNLDHVLNKIWK